MSQKDHWEQIYSTKSAEQLGWYAPHLQTSLSWIKGLDLDPDAPIIDVGAGASTLAEDLLHEGYQSITALDISEHALSSVRARLGAELEFITWLEGDVTSIDLPSNYYELWHDRAVFHFLTMPEQQRRYRDILLHTLRPGGNLVIGTFSVEAPPKCSGLPVQRYSLEQLQNTLGEVLALRRYQKELHITPSGLEQMYLYCHFQKTPSRALDE